MKIVSEMLVQLRLIDAKSGRVVSETKPQKNLIMDGGLNALAQSTNACYPANFAAACRVGSGATADQISSGAVTFTQVGTTITALSPFFTAGMTGWLFKYGSGTGGAESYITFVNSTTATSSVSATVAVPAVATVWNVTRSAMDALLYSSNTYQTNAGDCATTPSGPAVAHKRTYNFTLQGSPYTVNEIGYFSGTGGTTIFGRLVLGSSVVVPITNFLQVVLTFTVTYSPGTPAAVPDVGTNINTAGTAMVENIIAVVSGAGNNIAYINPANGSPVATSNGCLDASGGGNSVRAIYSTTYSQNGSTTQTQTPNPTSFLCANGLSWAYNSVRGQMKISTNTTITTAAETIYGIGMYNTGGASIFFDVKFTTPYVDPVGSFLPRVTFAVTYDRNLSN